MKNILVFVVLAASLVAQKATVTYPATGCREAKLVVSLPMLGKQVLATVNTKASPTAKCQLGLSVSPFNMIVGRISSNDAPCKMLILPMWTIQFVAKNGSKDMIPLGKLPNTPSIIGVQYYAQAACEDNSVGFWTNSALCTIGR